MRGLLLAALVCFPTFAGGIPDPPPGWVEQFTIADDVALLKHYHRESRHAGKRLILRGEASLPALHAALLSPESNVKQRQQILTALGAIGDPSSAGPVLAIAEDRTQDPAVTRGALAMLAYLSDEPIGFSAARKVLEDPSSPPPVKRQALGYIGHLRDPRGAALAARFRDDPDDRVVAGALWVAARLGDESAARDAAALIRDRLSRKTLEDLLMVRAELESPDALRRDASPEMQRSEPFQLAVAYAAFLRADPTTRTGAAEQLATMPRRFHRVVAARHLLAVRGARGFAESLAGEDSGYGDRVIVSHVLRRSGVAVEHRDHRLVVLEDER